MLKTLGAGVLATVCCLMSGGCRMCCPSYDYCEPMGPFGPNDRSCGNNPRYGSAFGGNYMNGGYDNLGTELEDGTLIETLPNSEAEPAPPPAPKQILQRPMQTSMKVASVRKTPTRRSYDDSSR